MFQRVGVAALKLVVDTNILLKALIKDSRVRARPTHSVILTVVVFLTVYIMIRRGLPYFAVILTHSLIGDYLTGPTQFLWPLPGWFVVAPPFLLSGVAETLVEVFLFAIVVAAVVYGRRG